LAESAKTLEASEQEWAKREQKLQAEIKEANRKQQQLADRTAFVSSVPPAIQHGASRNSI
jgi:hypothetical protein